MTNTGMLLSIYGLVLFLGLIAVIYFKIEDKKNEKKQIKQQKS